MLSNPNLQKYATTLMVACPRRSAPLNLEKYATRGGPAAGGRGAPIVWVPRVDEPTKRGQPCGLESRRRQQSIREAKVAAGAAEVATWASLLEEEMEAGLARDPEVEYDDWGYYFMVMEDNYEYNL